MFLCIWDNYFINQITFCLFVSQTMYFINQITFCLFVSLTKSFINQDLWFSLCLSLWQYISLISLEFLFLCLLKISFVNQDLFVSFCLHLVCLCALLTIVFISHFSLYLFFRVPACTSEFSNILIPVSIWLIVSLFFSDKLLHHWPPSISLSDWMCFVQVWNLIYR